MSMPSLLNPQLYRRRWMLFVDGENFTMRGQEFACSQGFSLPAHSPWYMENTFLWIPNFSLSSLHSFVQERPHYLHQKPERAFYYTSVQGALDKIGQVREKLWTLGFSPQVFQKPKGRRAKGVDIALTKDLLSNAFFNNYEIALLVTGDGDYLPVIEEIKRLGKMVVVLFFAYCGLNSELRLASDAFIDVSSTFHKEWARYYYDHGSEDDLRVIIRSFGFELSESDQIRGENILDHCAEASNGESSFMKSGVTRREALKKVVADLLAGI